MSCLDGCLRGLKEFKRVGVIIVCYITIVYLIIIYGTIIMYCNTILLYSILLSITLFYFSITD